MSSSGAREVGSTILAAIAGLGLVSCGGGVGASGLPTETSPPAADLVMTGSLTPGGVATHSFDVAQPGQVEVTLVSLDPPEGRVGLAVGVATLGSCSELTSTPEARPGLTVAGWVVDTTYCVTLSDVGDLAGRTAYRLTIKRP
jgi:hypothetical protein